MTTNKKFICQVCFRAFSRLWNMQRHASDSHGINFRNLNTDLTRSTTFLHNKSLTHNVVPNPSYSSWDNTLNEITRMYGDYTKSRQIEGNSNNMFETVSNLQQQVNYLQNQLLQTHLNNVITPKNGFLGISGYFCKGVEDLRAHT